MTNHETIFDANPQVGIGVGVRVHGNWFPARGHSGATTQVCIDTGAATTVFYPTADGLDELADGLRELARTARAAEQHAVAVAA